MGFDLDAALAEILSAPVETFTTPVQAEKVLPDTLTEPDKSAFCPVSSGCRVTSEAPPGSPAPVLPFNPPPSATAPSRDDDDMFRHGRSIAGSPVTWTGRIIRLDDWRQLSAWDRHGPDGRHFCGICRAWVQPDSFPHCHGGNGGAA